MKTIIHKQKGIPPFIFVNDVLGVIDELKKECSISHSIPVLNELKKRIIG